MDSPPDHFENLRRLLSLKRHEQPPPGYFDALARQVMRRLEAGERAGGLDLSEQLALEAPWLLRLWERFVAQPMALGGAGAAVCAVLLGGFLYLQGLEVTTGGSNDDPYRLSGIVTPPAPVVNPPSAPLTFVSSTNPLPGVLMAPSLFEGINVETQPAQGFLSGNR